MNTIHDIIIIWAWAAGLFSAINIPKKYSKLILEKNTKPWVKVLLSGWERANVSNIDIDTERDYFGQNKMALKSIFSRYNQWDTMNWFAENWINIVEEDRGRLILESWDSKELLNILVKKAKENNSKIIVEQDVKKITHSQCLPCKEEITFKIITEAWKRYYWKNVIVSSGGKSFFQVWTTWEWYNFAQNFWLNIIPLTRALWWLSTQKDLSNISGISHNLSIKLFDTNFPRKSIYQEFWPLLFTHFGISWPIIFNAWNALWEYLAWLPLLKKEGAGGWSESKFEKYILNNIQIKIIFTSLENIPKKVIKLFDLESLEEKEINLKIQSFRSWKEAKATWGWVDLDELDKFLQSKKEPWLFFIGEVCDITWKTGGFNLQWAWSSAYCCAENFIFPPSY